LDWDQLKSLTNRRDHGFDLETAALVFDDPLALTRPDPHPDGNRVRTVGVIGSVTVLSSTPCLNTIQKKATTSGGSSARARQPGEKGKLMKKTASKPLTATQRADLDALAKLPDDQINTRDIPEQLDWSGARRGMLYKPVKKQITLRIDADLIEWFRQHAQGEIGYQTRINDALREYVTQHGKQ
jgi:uncharacterized protein (DUF4415 family)/uncharacterized DUF497 family protein